MTLATTLATPLSPPAARLAGLTLGPVTLRTADPERLAPFYERVVGLARLAGAPGRVELGAGGQPLVVLLRDPAASPVGRPAPGLFHLAILMPDRAALATRLHVLRQLGIPFAASDHRVSEALYLDDPDGNGIEIYRDRPPAEWPRTAEGIAMATLRLDLHDLAAEAPAPSGPAPAPAGTRMGHVHLKVADLAEAGRFWCELMGLELMARYPGALFVAADGYHHHFGLNVWHSAHAAPPPPHAAGLDHFEIRLPAAAHAALARRASAAGVPAPEVDGGFRLTDPSGNTAFVLKAESPIHFNK